MGMVFTQHVTDTGGGLFEGFVGSQTAFVHGVQNAAVNRLQTVTDVGQGPAHDDGHGIFNVGPFHLINQIALGDVLIRKHDVLGFVTAVMCHKAPPGELGIRS